MKNYKHGDMVTDEDYKKLIPMTEAMKAKVKKGDLIVATGCGSTPKGEVLECTGKFFGNIVNYVCTLKSSKEITAFVKCMAFPPNEKSEKKTLTWKAVDQDGVWYSEETITELEKDIAFTVEKRDKLNKELAELRKLLAKNRKVMSLVQPKGK